MSGTLEDLAMDLSGKLVRKGLFCCGGGGPGVAFLPGVVAHRRIHEWWRTCRIEGGARAWVPTWCGDRRSPEGRRRRCILWNGGLL